MEKILIIDDSSTMRESINLVLSSAGYIIDAAVHGLDGLNQFKNSKDAYSLIITDINMPEMNGLEFLENLRKISQAIPVVVLTTETEKDKIEKAKTFKASAWIVKPFKPGDLLTVVKKVIESHK